MQDPKEFPWDGVLIMGATVLSLFVLFAVTVKIAEWVISARDELRDRYVGSRWKPIPIDILALPLWIALELLCFVAGVAFALLMMIVAYQVAKGVRDWWHAGDRERGR